MFASQICLEVITVLKKTDEDMPLTAQISLLPYANEKVAAKVLEHAQDLKDTDPKQAIKKRAKKTLCLTSKLKCYLTQIGQSASRPPTGVAYQTLWLSQSHRLFRPAIPRYSSKSSWYIVSIAAPRSDIEEVTQTS